MGRTIYTIVKNRTARSSDWKVNHPDDRFPSGYGREDLCDCEYEICIQYTPGPIYRKFSKKPRYFSRSPFIAEHPPIVCGSGSIQFCTVFPNQM